uniref:Neuropeptide-like GPCR n=1 Tax=Tripedalia cystophora TaxID=6141 RepID=A0A4D5XWX2_TRICY|nr:neuropeptide-like GPCR [Tripedalia cystophora]
MMECYKFPPGFDSWKFFELLATNETAGWDLLPPYYQNLTFECFRGHQNSTDLANRSPNVIEVLNSTTVTILRIMTRDNEVPYIKAHAWISIVTAIIGILGNALVLAAYGQKFKEISICRRLILHLAVSDFLFSILQIANSAPSIHAADWPYGEGVCKLVRSSLLLGSLVAIGTMFIIAIERYLGIVHGMKFMNGKRRVTFALIAVWITAIATTIPVAMALVFDPTKSDCEEQWFHMGLTTTGREFYDFFLLIAWFFVPLSIIFFCYGSIINLLRKPLHKRGFAGEKSADFAKRRRKEDLRVVFTLTVVVVVFALCCLPVRVMWILFNFIDINTLSENEYFALIYTGLIPYPLHVAVNPIIYCLVDREFRKEFRKMFGGILDSGKSSKDGKGSQRRESNVILTSCMKVQRKFSENESLERNSNQMISL